MGLGALQLTPPVDFNGRLTLQVQATAIEGSTARARRRRTTSSSTSSPSPTRRSCR
jgi:hypothetical protein